MRIERLSAPSERLPAVCVDNTVVWVNPKIQAPLALEEGKPCNLALMLLANEPEIKPGSYPLEIMDGHCRSGLLGRTVFQDVQKNKYYEIDLKGIGLSESVREEWALYLLAKPVGEIGHESAPNGLADFICARHDADMCEELFKLGIRTSRVIAIIKLRQILDSDNQLISIETAKERGIIKSNREPVISVRAFAIKDRLMDGIAVPEGSKKLQKAKWLVAEEFSRPELLDTKKYLRWFAKTLGKQVGLLHRNGYSHNYLTDHNITLDCRLTDFDSVVKNAELQKIASDYDKVISLLEWFCYHLGKNSGEFFFLFYEEYHKFRFSRNLRF